MLEVLSATGNQFSPLIVHSERSTLKDQTICYSHNFSDIYTEFTVSVPPSWIENVMFMTEVMTDEAVILKHLQKKSQHFVITKAQHEGLWTIGKLRVHEELETACAAWKTSRRGKW